MSEIPEDIMKVAAEIAEPRHIAPRKQDIANEIARAILAERERSDIACQALIDEYVTAERARCANSVWDFYYGEKRGHVTPEEFAEFLQPKP